MPETQRQNRTKILVDYPMFWGELFSREEYKHMMGIDREQFDNDPIVLQFVESIDNMLTNSYKKEKEVYDVDLQNIYRIQTVFRGYEPMRSLTEMPTIVQGYNYLESNEETGEEKVIYTIPLSSFNIEIGDYFTLPTIVNGENGTRVGLRYFIVSEYYGYDDAKLKEISPVEFEKEQFTRNLQNLYRHKKFDLLYSTINRISSDSTRQSYIDSALGEFFKEVTEGDDGERVEVGLTTQLLRKTSEVLREREDFEQLRNLFDRVGTFIGKEGDLVPLPTLLDGEMKVQWMKFDHLHYGQDEYIPFIVLKPVEGMELVIKKALTLLGKKLSYTNIKK